MDIDCLHFRRVNPQQATMEIKGLTSLELSIVFYLMFSIFDVRILVVRAEQLALNSQVRLSTLRNNNFTFNLDF